MYMGFSSVINEGLDTTTYGIDTVIADIRNAFTTPLESRVGKPREGSIIPLLHFENSTPDMEKRIKDDVARIISADPRVQLQDVSVDIDPDDHSITLRLFLVFIEMGIADWVEFSIDALSGSNER